ncbi:peroxide stress protein YaaA [Desulfocastanea catecholica]
MQIITAPSKTQQCNGRIYAQYTQPLLLDKAKILIDRLKLLDRDELSRLMRTSERLTESTYQRIHTFTLPFSPDNAKQALFTFQGDAYSAIQAADYSPEQLRYAQEHLFILSGLYGLLRPLDLMQPYRLEMGCSLSVAGVDTLYQFWREKITASINEAFAESADRVLVNLASKEYAKVVDERQLQAQMVHVTFQQKHQGRLRTIAIHAKRARGMMIDFAITNHIDTAAGLQEFRDDGYSFSRENSSATKWFFVKSV